MRTFLLVLISIAIIACGPTGTTGAGGSGGDMSQAGTGGAVMTGETTTTEPEPVVLRVGDDGTEQTRPCVETAAWRAAASEQGDLASKAIVMPTTGTIRRVTVVHAMGGAGCAPVARSILVSTPQPDGAEISPTVHEVVEVSAALATKAMPSDLYPVAGETGADLATQLHVEAGDVVYVSSVMVDDVCVVSCVDYDGGPAASDSWCTEPDAWGGCGLMSGPYPGAGKAAVWMAWLDVESN